MNKKVLLQDLSDGMAQRKGLTRKDAELFVRSVFEVIGEYLQTDKIVKVKGLGTFKLVTVENRASVDVNTGERIVIKGYTKVSFTPDAALRDEINKPFAQFETVVLNEGTDVAEMERVETSELSDLPEPEIVEAGTETPAVAEAAPSDTFVSGPVEEVTANTAAEEQAAEEIAVETAAIEEEATEEEPEVHAPERESVPVPEEDADKDREVPSEKPVREPAKETRAETEVHVSNQQVEFQKVEHQTVENQHIVQVAPEAAGRKCALPGWAWASLCLAVVLLMCVSYYAGHAHWFCSGECRSEAAVAPRKAETGKKISREKKRAVKEQDSAQVRVKTQTGARENADLSALEPQKPACPQVEGGKYEITGTKKVHQLKAGETLRGLALKYYGSKYFVDYIIVYNDIKNPDVVPVNMELKLPELTLKRR